MPGEKITIAHLVNTFPPYRGGMGNVCYHLADQLSRLGYEVTVFTPRYRRNETDLQSYFKIDKLTPQFQYGNSAIVLQAFWRLLKFDLVHFHYPFMGAGLATMLAKLVRGKKLKLIVHYHMDLVGQGWKSWVYKIYNAIFLKGIIARADKVIVTSEDYLRKSLIYPLYLKNLAKFTVIPNGVDVNYFQPAPKNQSLLEKYRLAGKKVLLFVGALDSQHYFKGVNYLIKAVELLKRTDLKLIIVGDGDLRPIYEDLAESYGIAEQIIFTGYLPDAQLVDHYNLCDIFVLPSIDKSEAFGVVLIEAMACAKPVLASSLPGVREVVEAKVNGRIFKPKDVNSLILQLTFMLNDPAVCREYGLNGRAKVEQRYSWDKITADLLKIYLNKDEILPHH